MSILKTKKNIYNKPRFNIDIIYVIPFGFEPKTYCLEGSCSIQLSYGTLNKKSIYIKLNEHLSIN